MEKELNVNDILNAKEIYLYDNDTLYVVDNMKMPMFFLMAVKGGITKRTSGTILTQKL